MDSVEANAAFAQRHQFLFPLLSDTTGEVCRAYDACSGSFDGDVRRITYVIDPDGTIRHIHEDVDPEGHIESVLAFLRSSADYEHKQPLRPIDSTPQVGMYRGTQSTSEGEYASMDEQENSLESDPVSNAMMDHVKAARSQSKSVEPDVSDPAVTNVALIPSPGAAPLSPERLPLITPSQVQPAQTTEAPQMVFALGTLGTDFGTESRRDSIIQHMGRDDLLKYLGDNPSQAAAIIWTLNLDATPIYAIQPYGAFADEVYARLREFLGEQLEGKVERVSIPGIIAGRIRLQSGQVVPVIVPEVRCMYSWTTSALVEADAGKPLPKSATAKEQEAYTQKMEAVTNFLRRIYDELRNLGVTSQDRALNYAAANIANANKIFESALEKNLDLDGIEVAPSPICRPGSDCWDVKLLFFDPENVLRAKTAYRFSVDVSDVCPVMVGEVRSWSER
jgi:cyanobactin maturation PatA/PatG family protease